MTRSERLPARAGAATTPAAEAAAGPAAAARPAEAAALAAAAPAAGGRRLLDLQAAAVDFLAVQLADRLLSIFFRGHLHEAEAPGATGIPVGHHRGRLDC